MQDGWNVIVGADTEWIGGAVRNFAPKKERSMIFGEVGASGRIVEVIRGD